MSRPRRETFHTKSRSNFRAAASRFICSNRGLRRAPILPDRPCSTYTHSRARSAASRTSSRYTVRVVPFVPVRCSSITHLEIISMMRFQSRPEPSFSATWSRSSNWFWVVWRSLLTRK